MPKKAKKKAPHTAKAARSASASPVTIVAARVLRSLPALSDAARRAFDAQTGLAEQAELGGRTKSDGVAREASQWIAQIDAAKKKFGAAIPYGAVRLAYLCTTVLELADARAAAGGDREGAVKAAASRDAALSKARAIRAALLHKLEQIARGNAHDVAALEVIERDTRHDESLAAGLDQLAQRADAVLARHDDTTRALIAGAELTSADADGARAASGTLVAAGVATTDAGRRQPKDSPSVNLAEGKVLAEMRVAEKAFRQAHEHDPQIARLVPGPATRSVLASHPHAVRVAPAQPATAKPDGAPALPS